MSERFKIRSLSAVVAGAVAIGFSLVFITACEPEAPGPEEQIEFPVEPQQQPDEPEPVEVSEQEEIELGDIEIPDQEPPSPEAVDIEDPDRAPDTVIATVDGEDVTLQDLYDEFDRIHPQQQQHLQHQQPQLLEQLILKKVLMGEAREKEVEDSQHYKEMFQQLEASPMAAELEEDEIKESAMMETLLQLEVVEKVDISEEELRELFAQYQQMMPEDAEFEQMRPQLEQMMLQEHVMEYIQQLQEDAEIEMDEDWITEKQEEAADVPAPTMPEGEVPPQQ